MRRIIYLVLLVISFVVVHGCPSSSDDNDDEETISTGLPGIDEMENGWNVIKPGGETTCSRGTEFAFYYRKGSSNNVVIDFQGGGACWNSETCSIAGAIFPREQADDLFSNE